MRKVEFYVYKFDELTEEAKVKATEDFEDFILMFPHRETESYKTDHFCESWFFEDGQFYSPRD